TKEEIYALALQIAADAGLPVSSWQAGDPTRSLYILESQVLATLDGVVVGYIKAGFLDYAVELAQTTGDPAWLNILAKQTFNVDVPSATFASTDVELTNSGGGVYDIDPGDLTLKNTTS